MDIPTKKTIPIRCGGGLVSDDVDVEGRNLTFIVTWPCGNGKVNRNKAG
jgi:hypothetical protein